MYRGLLRRLAHDLPPRSHVEPLAQGMARLAAPPGACCPLAALGLPLRLSLLHTLLRDGQCSCLELAEGRGSCVASEVLHACMEGPMGPRTIRLGHACKATRGSQGDTLPLRERSSEGSSPANCCPLGLSEHLCQASTREDFPAANRLQGTPEIPEIRPSRDTLRNLVLRAHLLSPCLESLDETLF
jgi:hypothetical protein